MVDIPSTPVTPVRPAAPYIGGKRNLSARLCAMIDATPHRTYVEPFVGMGGVFLRRRRRPPVEVVNDISGDVATLCPLADLSSCSRSTAVQDGWRWTSATSRRVEPPGGEAWTRDGS